MQLRAILTSIAVATALFAGAHAGALAQNKQTAGADETILEMADAFKKSDRKRLTALLPTVRGNALEPWAAYWELRARLESASNAEIADFLQRYAGTYQEDRLRNDWLLLLGQVRDWPTFMAQYPKFRMNDDRSVRCYAMVADPASAGADAASQLQDLWLDLKDADDGCALAAEQSLKAGKLKPHVAWLRARLGMENGRLRVASQAVGLLNRDWADKVNTIYAKPERYLDEKLTALLPRTRELVTLAMIRLAVEDPAMAALQMDKLRWRTQLSQEERSWIWGVIGKRAALRLSDAAMAWFAKAPEPLTNDDQLAWKVRAALRQGMWNEVLETTAHMSDAQRKDPAWVYWRARALLSPARAVPSDRVEAKRLLESIAGVRGFYEQLALEELGQKIEVPPRPAPLSAEEKAVARDNPGLNRALYAIAIGLRSEGVREWNYTIALHDRGGMDDRSLLAAADLACEREVWDRCINTSERTREVIDFDQRFPMPFRAAVVKRTAQIGLDPAYVYGLIRQESRFIMDARSHVGASGLMQIMPATARWTARKIGMTNFTSDQITERETNIAIGTGYLKLILDDFSGSMALAAAAYNAGPGRPRAWRNGPVMDAAIWAENVPFAETRDYVKKVLSNTTNYAAVLSGQPQSLKARLGTIGPRLGPELDKDLP
ncbi:MAG: transglycosylase SLT domain-containing protein [Burkholderiaceae bacterium]